MKRPLACLGITYLAVIAAAFYVKSSLFLWAVLIFAFVFAITLAVKLILKKRVNIPFDKFMVCLAMFAGVFTYVVHTNYYFKPLSLMYGETKRYVCAKVCEKPEYKYERYYYTLETITIDGEEVKAGIILSCPLFIDADIGDIISTDMTLENTDNSYYISDGINFTVKAETNFGVEVEKLQGFSLYKLSSQIRESIGSIFDRGLPEENALFFKALVLGDKSQMSEYTIESFRKSGVSHFIVVSGLHMSVVGMFFLFVLRKLLKNKFLYVFGSCAVIILYMGITGFSPSVVRAGVMFIVYVLGMLFNRKPDSFSSLGLAALILTFANPYAGGDVGLLLSVTATLGILLWNKRINSFLKGKWFDVVKENRIVGPFTGGVLSCVSVSLSATIGVLPLQVWFFQEISLVGIVTNLLIVPLSSPLIICALLFAGFSALSGFLWFFAFPAGAVGFLSRLLSDYVLKTVEFLGDLPFSKVDIKGGFYLFWIIFTVAMFAVGGRFKKKFGTALPLVTASFTLLVACIIAGSMWGMGTMKLHVLRNGGGNTVLLTIDNNSAMLTTAGKYDYENEAISYIESNVSGKLDFLAVTENYKNSGMYADEILQEIGAQQVLFYHNEKTDDETIDAIDQNGNVTYLQNDKGEVSLWNKAIINYIKEGNGFYQYIKISEGYSLLIIPTMANIENLSEEYRYADIIVGGGSIKNSQLLSCQVFVDTSTTDYKSGNLINYDMTVKTCEGNVVLNMSKKNEKSD